MNLRLSPLANDDIETIWRFIARENPSAADRVEQALHSAMELLSEYPGLGHARRDVVDQRYRFWRVYSYLIAYRVEGDSVLVARVLHGSRDVRRELATGE